MTMEASNSASEENGAKSVSFVKDIQLMMFGLGDCSEPSVESAQLVERVVLRQMVSAVAQASAVATLRGHNVIGPDDFLFLMRKNMDALKRLLEYLAIKDERQMLNKTIKSVSEPDEAVEGGGFDMDEYPSVSWDKSRRQYCLHFLHSIDIDESDIMAAEDTIKMERQLRANQTSLQLSQSAYESFHAARRASFGASQVTAKRFESWLRSRGEVTYELKPPVLEVLVYLAKETVATLVDRVLSLREENITYNQAWQKESRPNSPFSVQEIMEEEFDEGDLVDVTALADDTALAQTNGSDDEGVSDDDAGLSMMNDTIDDDHSDLDDDFDVDPPVDDADVVFSKHVGSIFSCCMEPKDNGMAVTGGEDNTVYFWDSTKGTVIHSDSEFEDSVISVEFSHDGRYVAAVDMGGCVRVWRLSTGESRSVTEVWSGTSGDEGTWLKWHRASAVLLCGGISGHVSMWRIPSGHCKMLPGYGSPTEAGMFMPDGKRAVVGYKDGSVRVFDLGTCSVIGCVQSGVLSSVLCLDAHPNGNLVVVGTINSKVALFATQTSKLISIFTCVEDIGGGEEDDDEVSVESVLFSKDVSLPIVAIGTTSSVHIWDYSKQVMRGRIKMAEGICTLLWGPPQGNLLYVGTMEGPIIVIDTRLPVVVTQLRGHSSNILALALSKNGKKLLAASDRKGARIFLLEPPLPSELS